MNTDPIGDARTNRMIRNHQLKTQQAQTLAKILLETPLEDLRNYNASNGGDSKKLRGIPAIGRSVAGAIPGTSPHQL